MNEPFRFNPKHSNGKMAVIAKERLANSREKKAWREARAKLEAARPTATTRIPSVYRKKPDDRHQYRVYMIQYHKAPALNIYLQLCEEEADTMYLTAYTKFTAVADAFTQKLDNLSNKANSFATQFNRWEELGLSNLMNAFHTTDCLSSKLDNLFEEANSFRLDFNDIVEHSQTLYHTEEINELIAELEKLSARLEVMAQYSNWLEKQIQQAEIAIVNFVRKYQGA